MLWVLVKFQCQVQMLREMRNSVEGKRLAKPRALDGYSDTFLITSTGTAPQKEFGGTRKLETGVRIRQRLESSGLSRLKMSKRAPRTSCSPRRAGKVIIFHRCLRVRSGDTTGPPYVSSIPCTLVACRATARTTAQTPIDSSTPPREEPVGRVGASGVSPSLGVASRQPASAHGLTARRRGARHTPSRDTPALN